MSTFNEEGLIRLGVELQKRQYDFVQPSVAEVKRYRRKNAYCTSVVDNLFGWGVGVDIRTIDTELLTAMEAAGVARYEDNQQLRSAISAATVDGCVTFHTSGPNAAANAVFLGPDTYRFIDSLTAWLRHRPLPTSIYEVGSGSGAASIAMARQFRTAVTIGCDINLSAIHLAKINAKVADVSTVEFRWSDVLSNVQGVPDLIISNPPFIADSTGRTYRDGGSMLGMELPLRILREAGGRLSEGGALFMYTASPVVAGNHFIEQHLREMYPSATIQELETSIFNDLLDLREYNSVDRVAAIAITITR